MHSTEGKTPVSGGFDIVIVGGGPASLSAAIYASRAMLKTLVLERMMVGGQVASTTTIDNYPGFPEGVDGPELVQRMHAQAQRFGAEFRFEEVTRIDLEDDWKVITTTANTYRSPTLVLATGASPRKLEVPGEEELAGRGVSYCGTCDAPLFRDRDVVVVGGGNSALTEALFIARFAGHVTIIHRRDELRGDKIYRRQVFDHPRIVVEWDSVVKSINGVEKVEGVTVRNVRTDAEKEITCDGVFIFVGHTPNTGFLKNLFPDEANGEIETQYDMSTSIPGVYAVGDVRRNSFRQIATAVGEGATAAIAAEHWISHKSNAAQP